MHMKKLVGNTFSYGVLGLLGLLCLLPFYLTLVGSITDESYIRVHGYSFIPTVISFTAYKVLLFSSGAVLNGYMVSIFVLAIGTPLSLLINSMLAYTISQKRVKYRNVISFISYLTMLFNGGIVSWYIVCVNFLHLKDNIFALIIPYLVNAFYVMFIVNYFRGVPQELFESAVIDGAGELSIFFKIMLPVSVPVLATVGLFTALQYWNDWWLGIMLIDKERLQPLQILLRTILSNIQFLNAKAGSSTIAGKLKMAIPAEGVKMATCIVTIGPIIFLYPYIQKFFIKGIMIGAVKG